MSEGPCREKYWEELDSEGKIEKLADRLEYLQRIVNDQAVTIQRLQNHVHMGERMYFCDGPSNPSYWPNSNILNRNPDKNKGLHRIDK